MTEMFDKRQNKEQGGLKREFKKQKRDLIYSKTKSRLVVNTGVGGNMTYSLSCLFCGTVMHNHCKRS